MAVAGAQKTLTEAYPDRFLLGIGVSHAPLVGMRGHDYTKPLSAMRRYLDAMASAPFMAMPPSTEPATVIGALAPKMLELAAERTKGAHPYFVPPEHTAFARERMGKGPLLAPEQAVILEKDAAKARAVARGHMATYLGLPNYANNLKRLGFTDKDIADGGSDRLVDAIVAWGSLDDIARRVRAHHDAGADHVCIQVLDPDPRVVPMQQWRELASALL
jgi:probable F420-dependent oxidoreductase